jgi:apolipoprotein N-acyltransferase
LLIPGAPPAVPLICYEIIFPGEVGAHPALQSDGQGGAAAAARPGWMINVTNDGWFGNSSGPYQHFQQARVRAIEEGLPLVRAANTGISAVVDPLGRIIEKLPLGAEGVVDARLPQPIAPPPYTRTGDMPAAMMIAISLLLLLHRRLQPNALKA